MPSENINQIAQMMGDCDIATLSVPIQDQEIIDPNVVKVLSDSKTNEALFFKRKIDVNHEHESLHRHIGIYAYRVAILRKFSLSPQSEDEKKDSMDMIRKISSSGYLRNRLPDDLIAMRTEIGQEDDHELQPSKTVATNNVETTEVLENDARQRAKIQGYEGDPCGECGNFTLVRNGTCMKCNTCGGTSGCS